MMHIPCAKGKETDTKKKLFTSSGLLALQPAYILKKHTLRIFSLGCESRVGKWCRAPLSNTAWVCSSVPVTIFPTALSAAV